MQRLTQEEIEDMQGGISFWGCAGIVGIALFLIGVLDGFTRPLKCN